MRRLLLLGLNHATAPLPVREKLAFSAAQRHEALLAFADRFPGNEAVLLSTCNRVELYVAQAGEGPPPAEVLVDFLARCHRLDVASFKAHLYRRTDREVAGHLFAVASSLDSMVLGETQILGQVRDAYEAARQLRLAGNMLHPLFQRAVAVGRQVQARTPIGDGRVSVARVAVDCARRIFERFADKTVLCIGAGKMAGLVLRHFAELQPGRLLVCNRDLGRAQSLAGRFGGAAVPLEQLERHLVAADIVVSSTGASAPIITRERFEALRRQRRYRPIFMIDLAMPRDIEPSIADFDNVYLYNIDDLQQVIAGTQDRRQGAVEAARRIVSDELNDYVAWHHQRELGPLIESIYARAHRLAADELTRTLGKLPGLDSDQRAAVEDLARRVVNKVLHDPIHRLRLQDQAHGGRGAYLHAMEQLFGPCDPAPTAPPQTDERKQS